MTLEEFRNLNVNDVIENEIMGKCIITRKFERIPLYNDESNIAYVVKCKSMLYEAFIYEKWRKVDNIIHLGGKCDNKI